MTNLPIHCELVFFFTSLVALVALVVGYAFLHELMKRGWSFGQALLVGALVAVLLVLAQMFWGRASVNRIDRYLSGETPYSSDLLYCIDAQ